MANNEQDLEARLKKSGSIESTLEAKEFTGREKLIALRAYMLGVEDSEAKNKMVVVLLHGIRTYAEWQDTAEKILKETDENVTVYPLKYERYDLFNFLYFNRNKPINRVLSQLRNIKADNGEASISVIAHSFGTYILKRILEDHTDIKLHRVILCGSIIHRQFEWDRLPRFPSQVINEVGTKDFLPVMAKIATLGYGSSGTTGFGHYKVKDRYQNLSHSGFFQESFIKKFWIPFIFDGKVIASDWNVARPTTPWYIGLVEVPLVIFFIRLVLIVLSIIIIILLLKVIFLLGFYSLKYINSLVLESEVINKIKMLI